MIPSIRDNFLFISFALLSQFLLAQNTTVSGFVMEDSTTRSVIYAKVFFMGTQVGTTSDTSGYFKISIQGKSMPFDTLIISCLGYKTQKLHIDRAGNQTINVQLKSSLFLELDEMKATAGENPAWRFMRKLIENKERNNPDNLNFYSSTEYSKVRFDLNNFTEKTKKNIILKPFDYIWDNTNTTEDGVKYLPMLLTENLSEHYRRRFPRDAKDIILGKNTTGLAGPKLIEFTEDLYLTPNIYNNYITILGKSFPSPINDNYKSNYRFYLMDSMSNESSKTYKIRFRPKHRRELAFTGEMYFDSASYAITEINLRFDVKANVNFVRSYYITQLYDKVNEKHWMLSESRVIGDFTVLENASDLSGFFGRKRSFYSNYTINEPIDAVIFKGVDILEQNENSELKTDAFWDKHRTEKLSQEEITLIETTERVLNDKAFIVRKNLFYTIGTGYIPLKGIQIGNIYSFYSYNSIEHSRIKLGIRTDPANKFPIHISAYGAYGTNDAQFKYRISSFLNITKKSITRIGGTYSYDIEQIGRSFNQIELDNVLSSLVQIGKTSSRNYVMNFEGYFEKGITTGLIGRVGYFNKTFSPTLDSTFNVIDQNGIESIQPNYHTAGISTTIKFSYLNEEITGEFYDKKDLYRKFRKYPDVVFRYQYSDQNLFKSDFDYHKLKLNIRQKVRANKLGHFTYNVELGKTIGTVPYVLLDVPYGNQLILLDDYAFNLMRFMEFASDEFASIYFTHHFDGLILDRIPLINKLKWRTFVFGKSFIGTISDANNQSRYLFPQELTGITKPYFEIGFGFENIFKIAKMDFVWRLTPGEGDYYKFLIKPSFKFSF